MTFTRAELAGWIRREINARRKLYDLQIRGAKISKRDAEYNLALLEEIHRILVEPKAP